MTSRARRQRFLAGPDAVGRPPPRGSEQPAVAARYWVAVPWRPAAGPAARRCATPGRRRARARRSSWEHHQHAARESLRYTEQVAARLSAMGVDPHMHGPGGDAGAAAGSAFTPPRSEPARLPAARRGRADRAGHQPRRGRRAPRARSSPRCAAARTGRTWTRQTGAGCATPTGRLRRRCTSRRRRRTRRRGGWRTCCRSRCRAPWRCTSASGTARGPVRRSAAAGRGCARRWTTRTAAGGWSAATRPTRSSEAAAARRRARQHGRRDRLQRRGVRLLPRPRRARGRVRGDAQRRRQDVCSRSPTRACCAARFSTWPGGAVTLPLGRRPRCARPAPYAHRNIAHCVPLATLRLRLPGRADPGFSDPGGTLERIDPFDPVFHNARHAGRRAQRRRQDRRGQRAA